MTPLVLVETMTKELKKIFKNFSCESEFENLKPVQVFAHDLPRGDFEDTSFYPCVIVTLKAVEDDGDSSIATLTLTVGAYSNNLGNDWRDMFNIAEKIRQFILTNPNLDGFFSKLDPVAFEPLVAESKNADPFVFGIIAVRYKVANPKYNFDDFYRK